MYVVLAEFIISLILNIVAPSNIKTPKMSKCIVYRHK